MSPQSSSPPRKATNDRKRIVPVVVLVLIVALAAGIAVLAGGGDDGDDSGETTEGLVYADVEVDGTALPPLPDGGADPAEGQPAPTLEGRSPEGTPVTVDFGEPTLLAFLAHWCPHCQAELPRLVSLARDGAFDGLEPVVVLTGSDRAAPNFPPSAWLDREGWTGTVLVDQQDQVAAGAYGLTSYPYLVLVDGDGRVVARSAGELDLDRLRAFVGQVG